MNLTSNEFEQVGSPNKHQLSVVNFEITKDKNSLPRRNVTLSQGVKHKWVKNNSIDNKKLSPKILDRTVVHNFSTVQTKNLHFYNKN